MERFFLFDNDLFDPTPGVLNKSSWFPLFISDLTSIICLCILKVRDVFSNSLLLESSEYNQNNKNFSYICCNPIASIQVHKNQVITEYPDGKKLIESISKNINITERIYSFSKQFKVKDYPFKFINNGGLTANSKE